MQDEHFWGFHNSMSPLCVYIYIYVCVCGGFGSLFRGGVHGTFSSYIVR